MDTYPNPAFPIDAVILTPKKNQQTSIGHIRKTYNPIRKETIRTARRRTPHRFRPLGRQVSVHLQEIIQRALVPELDKCARFIAELHEVVDKG